MKNWKYPGLGDFKQKGTDIWVAYRYSEVPNRRADRNKRAGLEESATLLAYLLSKLINEQSGIFCLLHMKNCEQGGNKFWKI